MWAGGHSWEVHDLHCLCPVAVHHPLLSKEAECGREVLLRLREGGDLGRIVEEGEDLDTGLPVQILPRRIRLARAEEAYPFVQTHHGLDQVSPRRHSRTVVIRLGTDAGKATGHGLVECQEAAVALLVCLTGRCNLI